MHVPASRRFNGASLISFRVSLALLGFGLAGCVTSAPPQGAQADLSEFQSVPEVQKLKEGDTLRIAFPGAPNLDTTQVIRHDGRISLYIIGELRVTGMTPAELEQLLLERYENQLNSREVFVSVVSSRFTVKVGGAVPAMRLESDRPLTAFEAVMESGAFSNPVANTRAVEVRRIEDGAWKTYTLDLEGVLKRTSNDVFFLKPNDIVYIPKPFTLF